MSSCSFENIKHIFNRYKIDLPLYNQQWLICHKIKPNQSVVCTQFQVLLFITNNPIKHNSFFCTQLNVQTVLFQTN